MEALTAPAQRMAGLQSSLAYRQAGREGQQRMETLVGMGLPAQTDINKARIERVGIGGFEYSAPRVAFGTWGAGDGKDGERKEQASKRYEIEKERRSQMAMENRRQYYPEDSGGPQPAQQQSNYISGTPFADRIGYPVLGGGVRQEQPTTPAGSLTGFGGIPRFPFAGY